MPSRDAERLWKNLAELSAEALRMNESESARFLANRVARLIGLLPFVAGCEQAERTALSHLATYVVAGRGGARAVFDHRPEDDRDPLARLASISHFQGGDEKVLRAGMRRLALCMVAGYRRDLDRDRREGLYNPLEAGVWDGEGLLANLRGSEPAASAVVAARPADDAETMIDELLSPEAALVLVWES